MTYNIGMAVIIILLVVVVAIVLFGLGIEIRNAFLEYDELSVIVRVVGKNYSSSYTTTSFIQSGKVSVPQMHHHIQRFEVVYLLCFPYLLILIELNLNHSFLSYLLL